MKYIVWAVAIILVALGVFVLTSDEAIAPENGEEETTEEEVSEENGKEDIAPAESGIMGVVVAGPQCPVVREGEDCPDEPIETTVAVYRKGGDELVVSYQTGRDGTFLFDLFPGEYVVRAAEENMLPACTPEEVTVMPDEYANIQVKCDTGIR